MAVTTSLYDHTLRRFADGSNAVGDTYKLMLCSAATFNAANATLASITKTETPNGNGYATGGATLTGVSISTVTTNDAKFDADYVTWTATGGSISGSYAILYNSTDSGSPPVLFLDFGGAEVAGDGIDFLVAWNAEGIVKWTVT